MHGTHFGSDSVPEHLRGARKKGALATKEQHVAETPDYISAGADSAKETAIGALLIYTVLFLLHLPIHIFHLTFFVIGVGFLVWKMGRSATIGWARLERVNNLIESEKYEIEHNRDEEREELRELYQAKGLTGKLLDQVIDVMMADENRLLHIMLEEELGITLEKYDHPLKQAIGAGIGVFVSGFFIGLSLFAPSPYVFIATTLGIVAITSFVLARLGGLNKLSSIIWNLAVSVTAALSTFFLMRFIMGLT
ncbi:MAG: hypothetical protein S4CHLAM102_11660 [Chlamydiia bacterium]|nr:hypothetical protein [Chlamydiia bacterium]